MSHLIIQITCYAKMDGSFIIAKTASKKINSPDSLY